MINTEQQQSDHIYCTLLCGCKAWLRLSPATFHRKLWNYAEPKPFSWAKPAHFDFSSSNCTLQDHIPCIRTHRCFLIKTSLNPVPNAQVCVYLTVHITKLQLQTTFPKPLYIPHFACIHGTLAAENLDVCTACDSWDNNIQLTMVKDQRWQIYPNVVECLTLTLVNCHAQFL
jgi:hypothetical protein